MKVNCKNLIQIFLIDRIERLLYISLVFIFPIWHSLLKVKTKCNSWPELEAYFKSLRFSTSEDFYVRFGFAKVRCCSWFKKYLLFIFRIILGYFFEISIDLYYFLSTRYIILFIKQFCGKFTKKYNLRNLDLSLGS